MGRKSKRHEQVIREITSYIEAHLQERITVANIAKHAGYSVSWIQAFFKKETGENLLSNLLGFRIERAKKLLFETDLSITAIAFEVGFNSYTRFSAVFKERERTTPTEFRNSASQRGEVPASITFQPLHSPTVGRERFRDLFEGNEIKSCWKKRFGQWQQTKGELVGKSEGALNLSYADPLPENFSLSFEFCFFGNPHLCLYLGQVEFSHWYFSAEIGRYENGMAEFTFSNLDRHWNQEAKLIPGSRHKIRLDFLDDTIRFFLDETQLFFGKDPFPPEYPSRCQFEIGAWQTELRIRNLSILDFGFAPMVPAVRQSDALYRSALYDHALNGYLRLLESANNPRDIVELEYKIGMCYLKKQTFSQAAAWLSKVVVLPENEFWLRFSRHSLLELGRLQRDQSLFLEKAKSLFVNSEDRNAVRVCIERARAELSGEGFFERALDCMKLLWSLETPGTLHSRLAQSRMPDLLFSLCRYKEAQEHLERILSGRCPDLILFQALNNLADSLTCSGDFEGSERVLQKLRARSKYQYDIARSDIVHGVNLRAQGRFEEAISFLRNTMGRYPEATDVSIFAALNASHIYCLLNQPVQARELINQLEERFPESPMFFGPHGASFKYPPLFLEGRYFEAAHVLLTGTKHGGFVHQLAGQMVRAGILFELAGDKNQALSVWSEVTRRFRPDRCCFYGDLARSFVEKEDILETMPYPAMTRAEMFYLAGLLYKARGERERAQKNFGFAVAEDPTLNWYTWMAKAELSQVRQ